MAKGEYESDIFYNEILAFTKEETAHILSTGEQVQTQVLDGVRCPVCGERLKELPKGWGCVGFKTTGCKFVLWKEMAGKTLTEKHLRQMIEKGKSEVIKGFKSKKGTDFDARVKYSAEEGRVVFDFTPEEIGECPICGKDIIEGKRGFGCSGYKEGCKFVLWKEKSGKIITLSQAQRLLKGETIALKGFTAEDGTNFDSKIKLVPTEDPANPYKVDFVKTEKKTKKKSE
jgi:DNA topoisomerase-3